MGGSENKGVALVLSIVEGICRDQTLKLLVVAETILYRDYLHRHPDQFFLGSLIFQGRFLPKTATTGWEFLENLVKKTP